MYGEHTPPFSFEGLFRLSLSNEASKLVSKNATQNFCSVTWKRGKSVTPACTPQKAPLLSSLSCFLWLFIRGVEWQSLSS